MATIDDPKNPYTIIAGLTRENERLTNELEGQSLLSKLAITRLNKRLAAKDEARATLFDAIKHGDEAHQAWLKTAIDQHFAQGVKSDEQ